MKSLDIKLKRTKHIQPKKRVLRVKSKKTKMSITFKKDKKCKKIKEDKKNGGERVSLDFPCHANHF